MLHHFLSVHAGHRQVWHHRRVLDDLQAHICRLREARDRAQAAALILQQVASLPLFRRGRHGEVAERIAPCACLPTSAFFLVPDLRLCQNCARLPLSEPPADALASPRLLALWHEAHQLLAVCKRSLLRVLALRCTQLCAIGSRAAMHLLQSQL